MKTINKYYFWIYLKWERKYKNLPSSSLYQVDKIKKHSFNGLFNSCPLHYWTGKATENTDKCKFHIFWSPIILFPLDQKTQYTYFVLTIIDKLTHTTRI